jgi:hypothetical protein
LSLGKHAIHIDSYQYFYLLEVRQVGLKSKIAGRAKIANYRMKGIHVFHVFQYSLKLIEKGILLIIGKEMGRHATDYELRLNLSRAKLNKKIP